jgi:hypothetical protein
MSEFPKMLYRLDRKVADEEGLKLALPEMEKVIVQSEDEQSAAFDDGFIENLQDLIGLEDKPRRGRKPKAETSE